MSQLITSWVNDPRALLIGGDRSAPASQGKIFCEIPDRCDLLARCGGCVLTQRNASCQFGKKTFEKGPSQRSAKFIEWIRSRQAESDALQARRPVNKQTASRMIVKINGWYYLPYPHMSIEISGPKDAPMDRAWLPEDALTAELLDTICRYRPKSLIGDEITHYQKTHVPRFIHDLQTFYPDLFDLLSEDQKARTAGLSRVGRHADIATLAPGKVVIDDITWDWDGTSLTTLTPLTRLIEGEWEVKLTPVPGSKVKITSDEQVCSTTILLE